ncbi:hypothetical protein SLS62_005139 [Diatrype stigma]|uniref:P-loop containing nucleoside triphosphate hydrolase protein n=1 Tax=Diatrype stigma TaxID=117547 RepID=A0AAN9UVJ3_9PEZI
MNGIAVACIVLEVVKLLPPITIIGSHNTPTTAELAKLASLALVPLVSFLSPRRPQNKTPNPESLTLAFQEATSPEETCSWFSYYVSYGWLTYLTLKGFRNDLTIEDLPPLPAYDAPLTLLSRMCRARLRGGKTLSALCRTFQTDIRTILLWSVATAVAEYLAPFAMLHLLSYLEKPDSNTVILHPFVWITLLFLGPMVRSICYQRSIFVGTRLLVRVKATMIHEIYRRVLWSRLGDDSQARNGEPAQGPALDSPGKPASDALGHHSVKIESLVSYDADNISNATDVFYAMTASTMSAVIAMSFLYHLMGWPSLVGVAVLLSLSPLPGLFSGRLSRLHRFVMEATDARLSKISEYLHSIRTLKYFAWETMASEKIDAIRAIEQQRIWRRNIISMLVSMTGDMLSLVSLLCTFSSLVLFTDQPLRAPTAFTALALTEILRAQFVWLSKVAQWVAQGRESLHRVDEFFDAAVERKRHPTGPPAFRNATFRPAVSSTFYLRDISISFRERALTVVTGPTGSGKTTLLLSLLGETSIESGEVSCPPDVAYVPQTAWLLNTTVRQNILFFSTYDELRYEAVVHACDLADDLRQLPNGDLTHVGEQGSSLSGGQKQRISLARALYSPSSTLLLDDIFSALDTHTITKVYERCFGSELLADRTVILVTHFRNAIENAGTVVSLAQGKISSIESSTTNLPIDAKLYEVGCEETGIIFRRLPDCIGSTESAEEDVDYDEEDEEEGQYAETAKYVEAVVNLDDAGPQEHKASGRVPRGLIVKYVLLFGGYPGAALAVVSALAVQVAYFSITLWLSIWTGHVDEDDYAAKATTYLLVYVGAVMAFVTLQFTNNLIYQRGGWIAAKTMHEKLIAAVLQAPISWFDSNPVGRIINRFGLDTQSMDSVLVDWLRMTLDNGLRFALRLASIAAIMPIFALPAGFFCLIGFTTGEVYARAQISIKRLCAVNFSPVFSHFSDTSAGIAVIRARHSVDRVFQELLAEKVATHMRAYEAQYNCNRWVSVRSDCCAAIIATTAGCIAYYKSGSPGLVGFSLTNAIGLSQTILTLVRNMNELEVELNSFQRVSEYANIEPEERPEDAGDARKDKVRAAWPTSGLVEFQAVTARYVENGPDILHRVNFVAYPGERVAIIGRTGSGKSTVARTLIRSTHIASGAVMVDGVDIANIPLRQLRQSISLIPQESVVFSGDIRSNLDPRGELDEAELHSILASCSLLQDGHGDGNDNDNDDGDEPYNSSTTGLAACSHVAGSGNNFSNGQKQILGLARAMCRRSKVVILDEATASVDHDTDVRMQQLIRSSFAGSTIITIAHRLRTIMDYDRVIVMEEGRIIEIGTPADLIRMQGPFWKTLKNNSDYNELVSLIKQKN